MFRHGDRLSPSSVFTSSPHPVLPVHTQVPRASKLCSARVGILRGSRTAGGPSRFETQGCAADGTADSPALWRAATSDLHVGVITSTNGFAGCSWPSYSSSPPFLAVPTAQARMTCAPYHGHMCASCDMLAARGLNLAKLG
jgi:hypothetical protein